MDLHIEVGGALLSLAEQVIIEDSIFSKNMGYIGGALFFNCKTNSEQTLVIIQGSIFLENIG
jgi:hypothetical protein